MFIAYARRWYDINPSLFIKNKWLFISSEGFSTLEKKRPDMLSEDNAALPVRCDSPLQIVMSVWRPFCSNPNFLGGVWQPSVDNYGARSLRSLSRIIFKVQDHPKGRKSTLRHDFQANTRPRIFLKPMSPQDTGRQLWGNPGMVRLRQF